jgi:hypothetical protein
MGVRPRPPEWWPSRRLGAALTVLGLAMVPWLFALSTGLPDRPRVEHWPAAWMGLDGLEAAGLFATGVLLVRRDRRACLPAAVVATALLVDAWFDVLTATNVDERATAVVEAIGTELPLALLCAVLAARLLPADQADQAREKEEALR